MVIPERTVSQGSKILSTWYCLVGTKWTQNRWTVVTIHSLLNCFHPCYNTFFYSFTSLVHRQAGFNWQAQHLLFCQFLFTRSFGSVLMILCLILRKTESLKDYFLSISLSPIRFDWLSPVETWFKFWSKWLRQDRTLPKCHCLTNLLKTYKAVRCSQGFCWVSFLPAHEHDLGTGNETMPLSHPVLLVMPILPLLSFNLWCLWGSQPQ